MRCLAVCLAYLLFAGTLPAQEPAAGQLNIVVVEGDGAINNVRQRTAREAIVEVQDENHRPVAGAVVVFTVAGRGGVFTNGSNTLTVMTDQNGRAIARGLQARVQGQMNIRVNASFQGRTATTTVTQSNAAAAAGAGGVTAAHAGLSLKVIVLALVAAGAGAATGVAIATRGGGTAAPPVTTTITPGAGTVGAPR